MVAVPVRICNLPVSTAVQALELVQLARDYVHSNYPTGAELRAVAACSRIVMQFKSMLSFPVYEMSLQDYYTQYFGYNNNKNCLIRRQSLTVISVFAYIR